MSKKIDEILAEEGDAAENYELPDGVSERVEVSRPNLGRPTVISLRLSADEHGLLHRAAEEANLPVSTLIRIWALDRLREEQQGSNATFAARLERLEKAVFQRSGMH